MDADPVRIIIACPTRAKETFGTERKKATAGWTDTKGKDSQILFSSDQIKDDETDKAYSALGGDDEKIVQIFDQKTH
jgi:hypothetical protein